MNSFPYASSKAVIPFAMLTLASLISGCAAPVGITNKNQQLSSEITPIIATRDGAIEVNRDILGGTAQAKNLADYAAARRIAPIARRSSRPFIGSQLVDVKDDSDLPPIFNELVSINFSPAKGYENGRVTLAVVAERLSRITGVPVRIKPDVYTARNRGGSAQGGSSATSGSQFSAPPAPIQSSMVRAPIPAPLSDANMASGSPSTNGTPESTTDIAAVDMKWEGTYKGFLDHVLGILNLSRSYRDGVIVIERLQTETFELASFGGKQVYKMGLNAASSGTSGGQSGGGPGGTSSSNFDVQETGEVAALDGLLKNVQQMVAEVGGSVSMNEATGRMTVTAPRDVMSRIRLVVKGEDASMARQALIQLDVYSVTTTDADERGVDWSVVYKSLSNIWGATINSPGTLTSASSGNIGLSIISGLSSSKTAQTLGGTGAVLSLLNSIGTNAQFRPISLFAMNRQWARKTNLENQFYVSETTPSTSSSAGSGAPGQKTSQITTGDKFMVQPSIRDDGSINLRFGVSISELLGIDVSTAGSGSTLQQVQLPRTSGTDDQSSIILKPGEAAILTGLSKQLASSNQRTLTEGASVAAGGSRVLSNRRQDFLIVVRAVQVR